MKLGSPTAWVGTSAGGTNVALKHVSSASFVVSSATCGVDGVSRSSCDAAAQR